MSQELIDQLLNSSTKIVDENNIIRDEIIAQLREAVKAMQLNLLTQDIDDVTKRLSAVNTLVTTLESKEKSVNTLLNSRLKIKSTEVTDVSNQLVGELLSKLGTKVEIPKTVVDTNEETLIPDIDIDDSEVS